MENNSIQTNPASNIAESEEKINEGFLKVHENSSVDYKALAVEKIQAELKDCKGSDRKASAVKTYVANALTDFCQQNALFAEVLYKTKRTLSNCLKDIMSGCGNYISDIEVYRRATKFYFPDSEVKMLMEITVEDAPDETYIMQEAKEDNSKNSSTKAKEKPKTEKKEKAKKPAEKKKENTIQLSLF